MNLFKKIRETIGGNSNHKRLKKIKNSKPLVEFDKYGNIIKKNISENNKQNKTSQNKPNESEKKEENQFSDFLTDSKQASIIEARINEKAKILLEDDFNIEGKKNTKNKRTKEDDKPDTCEPYDFPGDIIISIKKQMNKFLDFFTGTDSYGNEISSKSKNTEKNEKRVLKISRETAFGKTFWTIHDFLHNLKEKYMAMPKHLKIATITIIFLIIFSMMAGIFQAWFSGFKDTSKTKKISQAEYVELQSILDNAYPNKRSQYLKSLPYKTSPAKLNVKAGNAILVDASSGCVLYEKNADQVVPPASITKLFVMYIVFEEIEKGNIKLDDVVPLPELSWAENQPKDSSLMHLGQGQKVTLRELLEGLAVASGNDAAKAVAYYISGSPANFVERMNEECKKLGLKHTKFVEPSGYDENNCTTARELATFTRIYITKYPESLQYYHSLKSIDYPKLENLPKWQQSYGDSLAVHQINTNPLLGRMEGVDGIKTGFIYESGYNLALTAKRGEQRFLSITLHGQGKGTKQGNEGRIHDGTEMMEWAFNTFSNYIPEEKHELYFPVPALAAKENKGNFVNLIPAWTTDIPVPHVIGETAKDSANQVKYVISIPNYLYGNVEKGSVYGEIKYKLGEITLETVPLVADRSIEKSGILGSFLGTLAKVRLSK